jgi:hypothetical protein
MEMLDRPRALPAGAAARPILDARDARGTLSMWNPAPGVVVTQAVGVLSSQLADGWVAATEPLWKQPCPWEFYSDWELMSTYDSKARKTLTDLVLRQRHAIRSSWFLTGSRLVSMGVATAGAATALVGVSLHATTSRDEWERAVIARLRAT